MSYILQGAKVLVGGKRHSLGRTFYEPTILSDATDEMLIFRYAFLGYFVTWGTFFGVWTSTTYDVDISSFQ